MQEAPFGEGEVIDEGFAGVVVEAREAGLEIGGVGTHQHGDLPIRRRLVVANSDISKTPAPRHFRCQVQADAAVEIEQEVVKGQIREPAVGDGQFGVGDAFRQQGASSR